MRAVRKSALAVNGSRRAEPRRGRPDPGTRLRALRWVPVPLALLAAVLGLLVMGSMQGQAAADLARQPDQAGGLALNVDTMLWMTNMSDATVDTGTSTSVTPASGSSASSGGYSMPDSMMPGMQATGDDRLRGEVDLSNVTSTVQLYSTTDFTLSGPGGKTWQVNGQEHSAQPAAADLQPGFRTTIDVYFDVPAADSKNLTLHWSRGGRTVTMPVNTGGKGPGEMHGMHM